MDKFEKTKVIQESRHLGISNEPSRVSFQHQEVPQKSSARHEGPNISILVHTKRKSKPPTMLL